ncbi:MAG: acetyl-CoA carboxylase carboxyl transferase subunit alpha [Legionellaceae bacterium]|nr:acetyl-CoA carboxylase carboxyl transferase subunit alpha [Legionellaceae bacterium]
MNFLDFEQPIAELEAKIKELQHLTGDETINIDEEVAKLEHKSRQLTKSIFSKLTPFQKVQLARHAQRPHTSDYIEHLFTDFDELFGDRHGSKGSSIIAGLARFNGAPVMVMGHEKGRKTADRLERNFGMPSPEDYRKCLRLMKLAEKYEIPVVTFIDTSGAYPGITAEEHNQSEAIARNLFEMAKLKTPIICIVIGEGGSGGALALGVGDCVMMLEYSVYSVISPEGCASILWKSPEKAPQAAAALKVTADEIIRLGVIDEVIPEPLGGAHRNVKEIMKRVHIVLKDKLAEFVDMPVSQLLGRRYERLIR